MSLVDLATAKSFLQINHDVDGAIIQLLIDAAEEYVSEVTGAYLHDGDGSSEELLDGGYDALLPTNLPINSITSITDADSDDDPMDAWKHTKVRILRAVDGATWATGIKRWRVTYDGGYGPATVPAQMKHAILDLVSRAYWGRGSEGSNAAGRDSKSMSDLAGSDTLKRLRPYIMRSVIA